MDLERIQDAKSWTSAILASVATGFGTWIAGTMTTQPVWLKLLVIAIFPALSTALVSGCFNFLQNTRIGRRILSGPVWIEGFWYIFTVNHEKDPRPIAPGLMYIHYAPTTHDILVVVYRSHLESQRMVLSASESILATYRDTDQQLMNVCLQRFEQKEEKALGVGTFLYESVKSYPTRYEGWMIRISEGIYRKQVAERIPESTIASNQKKFGNEWIVRTIEQYQDRKLAPSPLVS